MSRPAPSGVNGWAATAIVPAGPAYVHLPVSADQVEKIKESTVFHQGGGESVTIGQAMQTAIRHHQAGRLAEAEGWDCENSRISETIASFLLDSAVR